nr:hypothetical protein [Mesorhizobium sp. PAMC28654]
MAAPGENPLCTFAGIARGHSHALVAQAANLDCRARGPETRLPAHVLYQRAEMADVDFGDCHALFADGVAGQMVDGAGVRRQ